MIVSFARIDTLIKIAKHLQRSIFVKEIVVAWNNVDLPCPPEIVALPWVRCIPQVANLVHNRCVLVPRTMASDELTLSQIPRLARDHDRRRSSLRRRRAFSFSHLREGLSLIPLPSAHRPSRGPRGGLPDLAHAPRPGPRIRASRNPLRPGQGSQGRARRRYGTRAPGRCRDADGLQVRLQAQGGPL